MNRDERERLGDRLRGPKKLKREKAPKATVRATSTVDLYYPTEAIFQYVRAASDEARATFRVSVGPTYEFLVTDPDDDA